MAGVVGFEPTIHSTKNCCLTTWLHPNSERLSTTVVGRVQELLDKKFERPTLSFSCLQIVSISTAPVRLPACTSSCALAQSRNGRTFWMGQTNARSTKAA